MLRSLIEASAILAFMALMLALTAMHPGSTRDPSSPDIRVAVR